jgi:hypothetical protein
MYKIRNENGSAILIALCIMSMLTIIALSAVKTSNTDVELSYNQLHGDQAFYVAEAGYKRAISEIQADSSWNKGLTKEPFGAGFFSVAITDSFAVPALFDTIIIASTGQARDAESSVEVVTIPDYIYPFKYALFADGPLQIMNSMETDSYNSDSGSYDSTVDSLFGDIGSNDSIYIENGAYIGGDVVTSLDSGLNVNIGATVIGNLSDEAPPQVLEPIPQSDFDSAMAFNAAPAGLSGSYALVGDKITVSSGNLELSDGIYYFSSIILKNSASLTIAPGAKVTIYVEGNVEIKNSGGVNVGGVPGDLMFYSRGDVILKNSGDLYGVFYAPNGKADLRNSADFYGSIASATMIGHNSSKFHYDRTLGKIKDGQTGKRLVVAWKEL